MQTRTLLKILAGLLLTVAGNAPAQAAEVVINVLDQHGRPVPGAVVSLSNGAPHRAGETAYATIDQQDLKFAPQVSAVAVGTRVRFPNSDSVRHHVYSFSDARRFELKLYSDKEAPEILFDKPGLVKLGCNIHDWMKGYLYVLEEPWFGVTDDSGVVRLSPPPGQYQVITRHPRHLGVAKMNAGIVERDDSGNTITMHIDIDTRGDLPLQVEPVGGFAY